MLGDLIAVVKGLASVLTWKRQLDDEKRKKFASLCDKISDVLERISKASKDRRQSINLCAELRQYVEPMRDIAHGTLASDEINRLAIELDRVCEAWKQLDGAAEPGSHSYEGYIDQLAEGAGHFRGLANRLRATCSNQDNARQKVVNRHNGLTTAYTRRPFSTPLMIVECGRG